MILLAIDTSGRNGSLALVRVTEPSSNDAPSNTAPPQFETLELVPLEGGTFSAQLVPQIAALLQKHGLAKRDIGGFAVVSGPGSFTGLRVGLAAIKALAEILQKPIAVISRLEAVARNSIFGGKVVSAIDAARGEVYAGEYEFVSRSTALKECLLTKEEFFEEYRAQKIVVFDQALADAARSHGLNAEQVPEPRADAIARLGWEKIQRGEVSAPDELEANYIRRSDAEIFAKH
jgi:tRNA threonylcarbamoyladenosine biosynthesis protein TsaB